MYISGTDLCIFEDTSVLQGQPMYLSGAVYEHFRDRVQHMFQEHGPIYSYISGTIPCIFRGLSLAYFRSSPRYIRGHKCTSETAQLSFRDRPCIFQGQGPMYVSGATPHIYFRDGPLYISGTVPCIFQGRSPVYLRDGPLYISGAAPCIFGDISVLQRQPNYLTETDHVYFKDRAPCVCFRDRVPCTF
jgi:hypothetical protein